MHRSTTASWFFAIAVLALPCWAGADEAMWALLKGGGHVVLIRHAQTGPGAGDPPGMRLEDCSTQRNLSDQGREDAIALGQEFRKRGVAVAELLSSPWCRCRETARLAFRRDAEVHKALSNLYGRAEHAGRQVAQLKVLIARGIRNGNRNGGESRRGNLVLLTHGSTIHALTGVSPASGEMVVLSPQTDGGFRVAGRIDLPRR
jgi:broad specificity phosphatase PhoE